MVIKINTGTQTIESIDKPTDIAVTPDNRVKLVKTITGVVVDDGWHGLRPNDVGDTVTVTCTFEKEGFETLRNLSNARARLTVGLGKMTVGNAVIILRSYAYDVDFPDYFKVSLDIWKVK